MKTGGTEFTKIGPLDNKREKVDGVDRTAIIHLPVKSRYVALNESGTQRIGEDHPRAKLTNDEVEQIRDEYEDGLAGLGPRIGYRLLAKKFKVSKRTIRNIVHYEKRNQWADRWKKVKG